MSDIIERLHGPDGIEAAREIIRLREENARLREALKVAADFLDDAYTDIGRDEYKVAGFVARAAIREGGKDDAP